MKRSFSFTPSWLAAIVFCCLSDYSVEGFSNPLYSDIIWRYNITGETYVWDMWEEYKKGVYTMEAADPEWEIVGTADFNRDGETDLLWRHQRLGLNAIWYMTGNVKSSSTFLESGDSSWYVAGAGDFNGDGYTDILWRSASVPRPYVWLMSGADGSVKSNVVPISPDEPDSSWAAEATGDFNNDGSCDIVWRNSSTGYVAIWMMNGLTRGSTTYVNINVGNDYRLSMTGPFFRRGNTDLVWRRSGEPAAADKIWVMLSSQYYRTVDIRDILTLNTIPVDQSWKMGRGTGGYRQDRIISATEISDTVVKLTWRYGFAGSTTQPVDIYRRNSGSGSWEIQTTSHRPVTYTNLIQTNQIYDYKLVRPGSSTVYYTQAATKYVHPLTRGRVLLLVEKSAAEHPSLSPKLQTLENDLVGDGWSVAKNFVAPRHNDVITYCDWAINKTNVTNVWNTINGFYSQEPSANNHVFIIGHVTIPYSGTQASDNHPDHVGAWPADAFYGDMIGMNDWRDDLSVTNNVYVIANNCPGDGKFDLDYLKSDLEVGVSRVDFADIPAFGNAGEAPFETEVRLLARYLDKNHAYRFFISPYPLPARIMVHSSFGYERIPVPLDIHSGALHLNSRLFGPDCGTLLPGDLFVDSQIAECALGAIGGEGIPSAIVRYDSGQTPVYGTTSDLVSNPPHIGFYFVHGSYFADFNLSPNNLVKGFIATPNYGLAVMATSSGSGIQWYLHRLGIGATLGEAFLDHVKKSREYRASPDIVDRWQTVFGDGTLRLDVIRPPSGGNWNGNAVTWNASAEPGVLGYVVEWSPTALAGPWTLLGRTSGTSLNDGSTGARYYRIRAEKLIANGSGSHFATSQSAFAQR